MRSLAPANLGNDGNHAQEKNARRSKIIMMHGSFSLANAAQLLIIILGSVAFLYFARSIILPLLLAWIGSMTLKPLVRWLHKFYLPNWIAAALVLIIFTSAAGFGITWLGKPAVQWAQTAPETLPKLKEKYQHFLQIGRAHV